MKQLFLYNGFYGPIKVIEQLKDVIIQKKYYLNLTLAAFFQCTLGRLNNTYF